MNDMRMPTPTESAASHPCLCVSRHVPRNERVDIHHVYPQKNQIDRWGEVREGDRDDPDQMRPLCQSAHKNVHVAIDAMLKGEHFRLGNRYLQNVAEIGVRRIREGSRTEASGE